MTRLVSRENRLLLLLVFLPVAPLRGYLFHAAELWVPPRIRRRDHPARRPHGRATEQLAERLGEGVGGLLTATSLALISRWYTMMCVDA